MDTQIVNWEMAQYIPQTTEPKEEVANWPSEPYILEWDEINWN